MVRVIPAENRDGIGATTNPFVGPVPGAFAGNLVLRSTATRKGANAGRASNRWLNETWRAQGATR